MRRWKGLIWKSFRKNARTLGGFILKNRGTVLYYAGVVLALCAFACAAEQIRAEKIQSEEADALPVAEVEEAPQQAAEQTAFFLPDGAQIIHGYAQQPEWNGQNGCWQCHMGLDLSGADGMARSISDGTVSEFGENGRNGGYVELEIGAYRLRYCSIEPREGIQIGAEVAPGEVIGAMANNMPGETLAGAHVHLEIEKDGAYIDPASLLENAD